MAIPTGKRRLPAWIRDDPDLSQVGEIAISRAKEHTACQYWTLGGYQILCRIFDHQDQPIDDAIRKEVLTRGALRMHVHNVTPRNSPLSARCLLALLEFQSEPFKVGRRQGVMPINQFFRASRNVTPNTFVNPQAILEVDSEQSEPPAVFKLRRPRQSGVVDEAGRRAQSTHRVRILHVSDLHERVVIDSTEPERAAKIRNDQPTRYFVLEKFGETLRTFLRETEVPIDIACFTGDIADFGLAEEYTAATTRIDALLSAANVTRDRLFMVPGNHDINRQVEAQAWKAVRKAAQGNPIGVSKWMGGQTAPRGVSLEQREAVLLRGKAFWDWVSNYGRDELLPSKSHHQRLGYCAQVKHTPFKFSVLGLDTAWLSGEEHEKGKLHLTRHQLLRVASDAQGHRLSGFRLALAHHPLGDLADGEQIRIDLGSGCADLLLYGHQHEAKALDTQDPDRECRTLAAGSLYEGDEGDKWVNAFHVLDAHLDDQARPLWYTTTFFAWTPSGQYWHRRSDLYEKAPNGRLYWVTPLGISRGLRVERHDQEADAE